MALWNLVHRGRWGRVLDMALSVCLVGTVLFLLLNVILPSVMRWTTASEASQRPPVAYAAGVTPGVQLVPASATPEVTPTPTLAVAHSLTCATIYQQKNMSDASKLDTKHRQVEPTPTPSSATLKKTPSVMDRIKQAIAGAQTPVARTDHHPDADRFEQGQGTIPGLSWLPGSSDKTDGVDNFPPLKIPTPFVRPWPDDDENELVATPTASPEDESGDLKPSTAPVHKQSANAGTCWSK
jgi:hypothetical protein